MHEYGRGAELPRCGGVHGVYGVACNTSSGEVIETSTQAVCCRTVVSAPPRRQAGNLGQRTAPPAPLSAHLPIAAGPRFPLLTPSPAPRALPSRPPRLRRPPAASVSPPRRTCASPRCSRPVSRLPSRSTARLTLSSAVSADRDDTERRETTRSCFLVADGCGRCRRQLPRPHLWPLGERFPHRHRD